MHARLLLLLALTCAAPALAQDGGVVGLCHDTANQDRQPDFSADAGFDWSAIRLTTDSPPALQLNTNLEVLNPERIFFPFTQEVSVSYLYESAGHSAALGYFYYEDLVERGYVDTHGTPDDTLDDTLVDSEPNGIADFHEDLFSMSTSTAPHRQYLGGTSRRCPGSQFTVSGHTFYAPELAMRGCADPGALNANDSDDVLRWAQVRDARPGRHGSNISVWLLGQAPGNNDGTANRTGSQYGDQGLWPTVPNLLEPQHPANSDKGLGNLVFLHSDDDGSDGTWKNMAPVGDDASAGNNDGIPDYDVSRYDASGRPRLLPDGSPAPGDGIRAEDRRVNLGTIEGGREVVFFLVAWGAPNHDPGGSRVYPCLSFDADRKCLAHLISPTTVFFSKTFLNLDQNPRAPTSVTVGGSSLQTVAASDIGCPYGTTCSDTGTSMQGWLDQATLTRLQGSEYGLTMPHERAYVRADPSGNGLMPHVFVGAPSTDRFRWILGFEDLNGGGDRDFNDVSFMIHKSNGGAVRSAVVSGDLSPSISQDFTITEVTFRAKDRPYFTSSAVGPEQCRPVSGGGSAATPPSITYQVALDCRVCTANCNGSSPTLSPNPTPSWVDVGLPQAPGNGALRDERVTLRDFLQRSLTGSQLCWRALLTSPNDSCQPTIYDIEVSYKAMRAGDYGRASVSAVANAVVYGVYETPGRSWFQAPATPPSTRVVDGRLDLAERGHLYFKKLYTPETPSQTSSAAEALQWDSGRRLAQDVAASNPLSWRRLYSMNAQGHRVPLSAVLTDANGGEAWPASAPSDSCNISNGGRYRCDLDGSGGQPDGADRALLRRWLYGRESNTTVRTWPMGGVHLSTPAILGPAPRPPWWARASGSEQAAFTSHFLADPRVHNRDTVAYVGTMQGMLHGVAAGRLRNGDDPCTGPPEANGYFQGCGANRDYGSGRELFAYLPRKLLPTYVESYLRLGVGRRASMDASPSVADVDLGFDASYADNPVGSHVSRPARPAWTIGNAPAATEGAKTVLVSASGPDHPVVVALDITDPSSPRYPNPMWELDLGNDTFPVGTEQLTLEDAFATGRPVGVPAPDTRGSRHSPPLVRMDFGLAADGTTPIHKWVAVVATDYVPNAGFGGSLVLVDLKTGRPVQVAGSTGSVAARLAGVIPLVQGEGIGSEPVAVDFDENSHYELLYAVTTGGKVFRIRTSDVDTSRGRGRTFQVCKVADVQERLEAEGRSDAVHQGVYSSMGVRVATEATGKVVRLYVGTGNNPDVSDEAADTASPRPHAYLLAFTDSAPLSGSCPDAATLALNHQWTRQLGGGEVVWGGVTATEEGVYTTTAHGTAANACSLSETEGGTFYGYDPGGTALEGSGASLGGHGLASPVVHDGHVLLLTADGRLLVRGDDGWNNARGAGEPGAARVLMWDTSPTGSLLP